MDKFLGRLDKLNTQKEIELHDHRHVNAVKGFLDNKELPYGLDVEWIDDVPKYTISIPLNLDLTKDINDMINKVLI